MSDVVEHERREYKRLRVKDGVFAIRKESGWQLASVVDINHKGMGIKVSSESTLSNRYDFFDLFSCHEECVVKHLPGIIISHQASDPPENIRASALTRYGVKFFELPLIAQGELEFFINQHAVGQA